MEALKAEYDGRATLLEQSFDSYLQDTQLETERLDDGEKTLDRDYKKQMAIHESGQLNLTTKLTKVHGFGCPSYALTTQAPARTPQRHPHSQYPSRSTQGDRRPPTSQNTSPIRTACSSKLSRTY